MTSDFGVTAGHVEYSNRRFDFDTRHMVMIEVYRHTAALEVSSVFRTHFQCSAGIGAEPQQAETPHFHFRRNEGFCFRGHGSIACQFCTKFGITTTNTPTYQNVLRIEFHALVCHLHLQLAHSSQYIPLLHFHILTNQAVDRNDHRRIGTLVP